MFYGVWLYEQAFTYFHMGYASALAWVLFAVTMLCTALLLWTSRRWVHYGGGLYSRRRRTPAANQTRPRPAQGVPDGGRQPRRLDRGLAGVCHPGDLHVPDRADDRSAGAVGAADPASVRVEQLLHGVSPAADPAVDVEHVPVCRALDSRGRALLCAGGLRVRAARVEGPKRGLPAGAGDPDAAHPGDLGAALHPVGAPVPRLDRDPVHRHPEAVDHAELLRRRVLDLPAAPVLHDDPRS